MHRLTKNSRFYITLLIVSTLLCACRPKGILHSWEMRELLVDLHKTDALFQVMGMQHSPSETKAVYYAQVLDKHGVTQAQFDSSLVWYTAHPQLFDKIYPKVIAELKAEEERFVAEHEAELNLKPELNEPVHTNRTYRPELTQAQLDSTLWVIRNGYPTPWNPLPNALSCKSVPSTNPYPLRTDY